MTKSINFACFRHGPPYAEAKDLQKIYDYFESVFRRIEIQPTHFSSDNGKAGGEKVKKFRGAAHQKILKLGFEKYNSCSLMYNIANSKEALRDGYISLHFYSSPLGEMVECSVQFDERFMDFHSQAFTQIIQEITNIWNWDYGFGLQDKFENGPGLYIMSASNGKLPSEMARRLSIWYQIWQPEIRRKGLRDIFPYMIIGKGHLDARVTPRLNLETFIKNNRYSRLEKLNENNWLWTVDEDQTETVRKKLLGTGLILSK